MSDFGKTKSYPNWWRTVRARFVMQLNPSKREVAGLAPETSVSFIPMEAVGEWGGLDTSGVRPLRDVMNGYTFFRDGDVLVAKITPCFENGKGAVAAGLAGGYGFGTTELHVLSPSPHLDSQFLFYVSISHPFRLRGQGEMYGAGGQKRVPEAFLLDFPLGLPDRGEQKAIAGFLDRRTAAIDALIAKKERLIELLQEKRQALITQAVTKGLDPTVPMKDSGIDWLGPVPVAWKVLQVRRLFLRSDYGISTSLEPAGEIAVLRMGNIQDGQVLLGDLGYVDEIEDPSLLLRLGDLLFNRTNSLDLVGKVGMFRGSEFPVTFASYLVRFRVKAIHDPEYVSLLLNTAGVLGRARALALPSISQANLNPNRYGSLVVCIPPLPDQLRILDFLRRATGQIDRQVLATKRSVDALREYRQALITAAVTGQIDVSAETSEAA